MTRITRQRMSVVFSMLLTMLGLQAQGIVNPSFENGTDGWVCAGMKTQTNDAFSIKAGNTYMEKWTGGGGAVGDGYMEQTISQLPVGVYTLTVAAQNIQEGSPKSSQTGAWIFVDEQRTNVDVRQDYTVEFVTMGQEHRIGFRAEGASGNWIACDNFRLKKTGEDLALLRPAFLALIEETEAYSKSDMYETDLAALKTVIAQARKVYEANTFSGMQEAADALRKAQADAKAAIWHYEWDNASPESPMDVTALLTNPSFENGWTGWTVSGLGMQGNDAFGLKEGNTYAEKWVGSGSKVGDGSVIQQASGIPSGNYILTCAAQNIQQDNTALQSGAWVVAADRRTAVKKLADYSVSFTQLESTLTFGFKAENATGNWIACDNFRLYYTGCDMESLKAALETRVATSRALLEKKMNNSCRSVLEQTLTQAQEVTGDKTSERYTTTADALAEATANANASIEAFTALGKAIATAEKTYGEGTGEGAEAYREAIDAAIAVNDNLDSTNDALYAQIPLLEAATLLYRVSNPSGTAPNVVTDPRYVAACHEVFGRLTVTGVAANRIKEQGFVFSQTNPEPTVLDGRANDYLDHNGYIYRVPMEPGTLFYMRAYCMTTGYAVGYGDVIRVSTLPQGKVTWSYDYGSSEQAQNDRIENALRDASGWWTDYTSIRGFNIAGHWSPGTPTADCGYGGYCRIGTNMGQRCGTLLHEMNHGVGCGTLGIWGGWEESPLRVTMNGDWAGDRANNAIQFWENDNTVVITGAYDNAHWGIHHVGQPYEDGGGGTALWMNKYAINGAHLEPGAWAGPTNWNDTQVLFIGNSIITQGFMEDGLIPVNAWGGGHCLPAYVFEHRDNQKYYLTCEDTNRGRLTAYLTEQGNGTLKWVEYDTAMLTANDNAAWYVTFDAQKQFYQFQNVATGHYMTYSGSTIKAASKAKLTQNEDFHLMRRRAVNAGEDMRGYWIMNPNTMTALQANAKGATTAEEQNLWDEGSAQRWCILTADEIAAQNQGAMEKNSSLLAELIQNLREMQQTPHVENNDGADSDATLTALLDDMEARMKTETASAMLAQMFTDTRKAGMDFLRNVTPEDINNPFDLTFLIENPTLKDNAKGWNDTPAHSYACCEFFMKGFDFNQTIAALPKGTYKLTMQGFQRPGDAGSVYADYIDGKNKVDAKLYLGTTSVKINHIAVDAQRRSLGGAELTVGSPTRYVPDNMEAAGKYFDKGLYQNELVMNNTSNSKDLTISLKGTKDDDKFWTIFRNFHLYYYGQYSKSDVTPIDEIEIVNSQLTNSQYYNLSGQRVGEGYKGIVIKNGRKVIVR